MPKVTVAIPTYNRKDYLKDTLTSILNQSYQDFEIFVFDNASSNYDVPSFLDEFNDSRIRLIRNDVNIGNLQNLNNIFDHPFSSEYLVVFHDDDTMHPQLLEIEAGLMDSNPRLAWANCAVEFVHDYSKMFEFNDFGNKIETIKGPDVSRWFLSAHTHLSFDGAMYRVKYLKSFSPYTKRFFKWCDRPYLVDVASRHEACVIYDKLINYRMHPGQDSKAEARDKQGYIFELQKFYKETLPQPLSAANERLFYRTSTNSLVLTGAGFSDSFRDYLLFLKQATGQGLFDWRFLNFRGFYYALKVIKIYLRKFLTNAK